MELDFCVHTLITHHKPADLLSCVASQPDLLPCTSSVPCQSPEQSGCVKTHRLQTCTCTHSYKQDCKCNGCITMIVMGRQSVTTSVLLHIFSLPGVVSRQYCSMFPPGDTRCWDSTYNALKHCWLVNVD